MLAPLPVSPHIKIAMSRVLCVFPLRYAGNCRVRYLKADQAFTLVELLIVSFASLILVLGFGELLTSYLRGSASLKTSQAVRNDASRLEYLLQNEAGEAESLQYAAVQMPSNHCPGVASASAYFSLNIPNNLLTGNPLDRSQDDKTYYYNQGGDLYRCGRPFYRNGTLDFSSPRVAARVMRSTTLDTFVSCQGQSSSSLILAYIPTIRSDGNRLTSYQPGCSLLKAKSFFVTDRAVIIPP